MYWNNVILDSEVYTYEYFLQKDVCRLCWDKNANINLFDENAEDATEISLTEIIRDYLEIDVTSTNLDKVCERCCNELKRFYSYKRFCLETDKKLQYIYKKDLEICVVEDVVIDDNVDKLDSSLDITEFEAPTEKILMKHSKFRKKTAFKPPLYYCNICCLDLKSKEKLESHNNELHGIENEGTSFRCFGCEKRFKNKKNRASHEVNHCSALKDGYKCNICERYLPRRGMYSNHMKDHIHNTMKELPEEIFKCGQCFKMFKTSDLLKSHMKLEHAKEKTYVCETCGRVFNRYDYLYQHRLSHTENRQHKCPHCDFKAAKRGLLVIHIRKHTKERPFSCDMCPLRCVSKGNLRAHRRRHLGVKDYECTICNKKFGYKMTLEEHISAIHVRTETHSCEHCGATYARKSGLRRHIAAKHGKQPQSKTVEEILQEDSDIKILILKDVDYELNESDNDLLLEHQDDDVYDV